MTSNLLRGLALAAAVTIAGAAPVAAQPAKPAPMDQRGPGMDRPRMDPAEKMQRRAQRMRDVLQLRPNQEAALTALMEAMKPPEGMRERMREEHQAMMGLSTPERLDRMRDHMTRRQAEFDRRAMAIKRFYAQLTPAQQKAFDALRPMGGRMGKHHGGGMGRGHGGGHGMEMGMGPG